MVRGTRFQWPSLGACSCCQVLATQGRARASRMTLPHNGCYTPMFMPVGTQGAQLPRMLQSSMQYVSIGLDLYGMGFPSGTGFIRRNRDWWP